MLKPTLPRKIKRFLALGMALGGFSGLMVPLAAAPLVREAANQGAVPVNQLDVSGNACGPAALLNSFRFGDKSWQRVATAVVGDSDKARLLSIIRTWGLRPSKYLSGRLRWSREGVNLDDLCDIANEMTTGYWLPRMKNEILFIKPGESPQMLLLRVHDRLETSLAKGLPPIISIRRFAYRRLSEKSPSWVVLQGHFVTVTSVPRKLEKGATSFPVTYLDPWGGKRCEGRLAISKRALLSGQLLDSIVSPCLEADFPQVSVGKKLLRTDEPTVLTLSAAIGKW